MPGTLLKEFSTWLRVTTKAICTQTLFSISQRIFYGGGELIDNGEDVW